MKRLEAHGFIVNHDATGKASEFERVPRNTVSFNTSYRLHGFDLSVSVPFAKFLPSSESDWAEKWFVTFAVRNLFDERYFDTSRHYYECFVGEPRTFDIGVRGTF